MNLLSNKTAIITGGSRGIGAATARRFAENGADVIITYLNSKEAAEKVVTYCRKQDVQAEAWQVDAGSREDMRNLVSRAVDAFGKLDILVNGVGIFLMDAIEKTTDEDFEETVNINIRSVYLTSREAAKVLPKGGRIINIGSHLGERVKMAGIPLYALSKAAVVGFTRALAHDLGPKEISVNCVQPGPTNTDMNPADPDENPTANAQKSGTVLERYAKPEELADSITFLASSQSSYISGAIINVDGGANA
ncbi:3-oxoacyl-[acyl-carrier protein] reductase [Fodinibius roseus]|uniref:3-oxoacyl-[acyl-carrier protein] reductase n=2 Tax=Fodinibius roseus TaxID=1194090 RepID=A0A1M5EH50_9BACT|nr:3-oxoacyl-[acyl-carrier protein] reductase [Fodinibius roseus]